MRNIQTKSNLTLNLQSWASVLEGWWTADAWPVKHRSNQCRDASKSNDHPSFCSGAFFRTTLTQPPLSGTTGTCRTCTRKDSLRDVLFVSLCCGRSWTKSVQYWYGWQVWWLHAKIKTGRRPIDWWLGRLSTPGCWWCCVLLVANVSENVVSSFLMHLAICLQTSFETARKPKRTQNCKHFFTHTLGASAENSASLSTWGVTRRKDMQVLSLELCFRPLQLYEGLAYE